MMRMITEIVCPGVLLLGEVVMAPEKVVPYFGTVEKPECHMLYNVRSARSTIIPTKMATTWPGEKRVLRGVPVPARGYAWYYRKWN